MKITLIFPRACLKIAFCKIPSQFASDFMLDLGGVVGYIDEIQHIIRCKVGRKIVGMNFQTRSRLDFRIVGKGCINGRYRRFIENEQ